MNSIFSKTLRIAIVALLLGASGAPRAALAAEGYKVIVHQSNPLTSVPREQVARFFLKKVTSWPAGRSVSPVDREKDAVTRRAFSQDVLHKSVAEVTAYWQQQSFSGRAVPPPEKHSDAEVVAFVEQNEGAIGYVAADANVGDAKVIGVDD